MRSKHGIQEDGIYRVKHEHWNHVTPALYEAAIRRNEGVVVHQGPLVVRTGDHTGRAAKDKFVVQEATSTDKIWWGNVNRPFAPANYERLFYRLSAYLQGNEAFIQDCYAGSDPQYRIPIRVIAEKAWHALFARNMFIIPSAEELATHRPVFTVFAVPQFHARPDIDGTASETFVIVHFGKGQVIIGGTAYAGEIKKSVFTYLNYLLPQRDILTMHCSANQGPGGDTALFFGLSGTGKTTLSADPTRQLIGDDEHGWSREGIFNLEGGCYAKVIRLSAQAEPQIYACTKQFGTVLENVAFDLETRRLDLDDDGLTENTRAGFPLSHIPSAIQEGRGPHPANIIMLTTDAFGVLPPIASLTPQQAMYHFISGYTAKVAGTEAGLGAEPQATFSACFGAPFMALPPVVYANLLKERIHRHKTRCWLINTGWVAGPYGQGHRISIEDTRALVKATLGGDLNDRPLREDPVFGLSVPVSCPGVDERLLRPRDSWGDPAAYDATAARLVEMFRRNFSIFEGDVPAEIAEAGPRGTAVVKEG